MRALYLAIALTITAAPAIAETHIERIVRAVETDGSFVLEHDLFTPTDIDRVVFTVNDSLCLMNKPALLVTYVHESGARETYYDCRQDGVVDGHYGQPIKMLKQAYGVEGMQNIYLKTLETAGKLRDLIDQVDELNNTEEA
jgi:hypothetical protein